MSDALDNAFEADGLIVEDPTTGAKSGLFTGGVLPHVLLPDINFPVLYLRNDGEIYFYNGLTDASLQENWQIYTVRSDEQIGSLATEDNELFWMFR
jgi:hypothetical protein